LEGDATEQPAMTDDLDYSDASDQLTGGIRRIPITTAKGELSV